MQRAQPNNGAWYLAAGVLLGAGMTIAAFVVAEEMASRKGATPAIAAQKPGTVSAALDRHVAALKRLEENAKTPDEAEKFGKMRKDAEAQARNIASMRENPANDPVAIPSIHVDEVTGAPGPINRALKQALSERLSHSGFDVAASPESCSYSIKGHVQISETDHDNPNDVEITWTMSKPDGGFAAKVAQHNQAANGLISETWKKEAQFVATNVVDGLQQRHRPTKNGCS